MLKVEVPMSLKRVEYLGSLKVAQGVLIKLNSCKLEMLIWFILHDMRELWGAHYSSYSVSEAFVDSN